MAVHSNHGQGVMPIAHTSFGQGRQMIQWAPNERAFLLLFYAAAPCTAAIGIIGLRIGSKFVRQVKA